MDQMTFSGSCSCSKFRSNPFAKSGTIARKCNDCGHDIQDHSRDSVTEKDVLKALESNEKVPSLIIGTEQNGLYQGGWQAAMNEKYLVESNTGLVINTAGGLEKHFPRFQPESLYRRLGIKDLKFDWEDSSATSFTVVDMKKAQEAIQATLDERRSVLVHCAQGRSRSGSVVVYYVSRAEKKDICQALKSVQAKRAMAQPNDHFMQLLQSMDNDNTLGESASCQVKVTASSGDVLLGPECEQTLEDCKPTSSVDADSKIAPSPTASAAKIAIHATTMSGESASIEIPPTATVGAMKRLLCESFNVDPNERNIRSLKLTASKNDVLDDSAILESLPCISEANDAQRKDGVHINAIWSSFIKVKRHVYNARGGGPTARGSYLTSTEEIELEPAVTIGEQLHNISKDDPFSLSPGGKGKGKGRNQVMVWASEQVPRKWGEPDEEFRQDVLKEMQLTAFHIGQDCELMPDIFAEGGKSIVVLIPMRGMD